MSDKPAPAILDLTTVGALKATLKQCSDAKPLRIVAGGSRVTHAVVEATSGELYVACVSLPAAD